MVNLSGIWIPLVTPLRRGALDVDALERLVRHLEPQGVAGFMACGSTGEATLLDPDEQEAVLAATLAATGRPVWMGLSGPRADGLLRRAAELTARHPALAGFLVSAPGYIRPSQAALADHFTALADGLARPLLVYDIPARSGVRIEPRTLLDLAAHPNIVGVKDCSGDRAAAEAVLADGRLAWLAGNDDELFDQLARGACGGVVASAHVAASRFVALHEAFSRGDLAQARAAWRTLAPLTRALFVEPNPAPVKAVLARQGWLADELRAPLLNASAQTAEAALALI